jgi:hypothetical protein
MLNYIPGGPIGARPPRVNEEQYPDFQRPTSPHPGSSTAYVSNVSHGQHHPTSPASQISDMPHFQHQGAHMSLFQHTGISSQEHRSQSELDTAFRESRKRRTITHRDLDLLECGVRHDLCSMNRFARLLWSKAVCREFQDFFGLGHRNHFPRQQLFFVTLTHDACCTAHDTKFVDIENFKRQLRRGLAGLSYIGMVEPALYVNVAQGTRSPWKRAVSWHLHAICWGENRKQMKQRFCRLNRDGVYRSIMDGQLGAHQKQIPPEFLDNGKRTFLADKLRYMLKSPRKAYRIYKANRVTSDGEVVPCFRQKKSDLRKGDHITLFHLMKGLYLDNLAVGGGDGAGMLRRIKKAAFRVGPSGH